LVHAPPRSRGGSVVSLPDKVSLLLVALCHPHLPSTFASDYRITLFLPSARSSSCFGKFVSIFFLKLQRFPKSLSFPGYVWEKGPSPQTALFFPVEIPHVNKNFLELASRCQPFPPPVTPEPFTKPKHRHPAHEFF